MISQNMFLVEETQGYEKVKKIKKIGHMKVLLKRERYKSYTRLS
jgi:hypothetical protein